MTNLEAEFEAALREGCRITIEELNYRPTYFLQMMDEYGGVGASQRLLSQNDAQAGLTTLWDLDRLDLSVETYVIRPERYVSRTLRQLCARN